MKPAHIAAAIATAAALLAQPAQAANAVRQNTIDVDGMPIAYREAGDPSQPAIVLLHGFPSSSYMYRNLIPQLAQRFHVIAPDYPGSGDSVAPQGYTPTFEQLSVVMEHFLAKKGVQRYTLYVQDFGGPVGFRIAARHPERVSALVIQNANAYDEGLSEQIADNIRTLKVGINPQTDAVLEQILSPDGVQFMYRHGTRQPERLDAATWTLDSAVLRKPSAKAVQKGLLVDYHSNVAQYGAWQQYFRTAQPPALVVWGKNDPLFTEAGARAFLKDLPNAELKLLDTGHFALEEDNDVIARSILAFADKHRLVH
ncbi:alpha/beta fold hydrolase [Pseudoduganella ginsengisoli]|uniref:Alpha/beta fold hydrolase n=1 Tax=Pseudoduganella ginsengisoli TaxID=1462440 RepID=A0A6L6Q7G3_9BURK|nr:alpha/beta hydrolase [Pseudoduganella ginsengisoli]MTW05580.1 alpha/beta fold hydrolase [Pseudoduganella ginsengisoli]